MKTAAIILDEWKFPFFKIRLEAAGYVYTKHPGFAPDVVILKVSTEDMGKLAFLIRAAEEAAARSKMQ